MILIESIKNILINLKINKIILMIIIIKFNLQKKKKIKFLKNLANY